VFEQLLRHHGSNFQSLLLHPDLDCILHFAAAIALVSIDQSMLACALPPLRCWQDPQQPHKAQHTPLQRQRGSTPPVQSPFAAAAQPYGDQRCGFADPNQNQQQQQPLLDIPSLQQAEQLLQQLAAGGQQGARAAGPDQLQEWRQRWAAVAPSVSGLEQLASAVSMQFMDAQGECARAVEAAAASLSCGCNECNMPRKMYITFAHDGIDLQCAVMSAPC
jgi:hypothetical protein